MSFVKLVAPALMLAALTMPALALAQDRGSDADQEACTPDVFRLCQDLIPDEGRILACLQAKGRQLSGPCHQVIFSTPAKPAGTQEADAVTASTTVRHAVKRARHKHRAAQ